MLRPFSRMITLVAVIGAMAFSWTAPANADSRGWVASGCVAMNVTYTRSTHTITDVWVSLNPYEPSCVEIYGPYNVRAHYYREGTGGPDWWTKWGSGWSSFYQFPLNHTIPRGATVCSTLWYRMPASTGSGSRISGRPCWSMP